MKSAWVDRDAEAIVAHGAKSGVDRDLALRIYTTRLLGRDPKLVLHGGGNTSLKTRLRDRFGEDVEVLRIKASGADMAAIELEGLPAVRLDPLRRLRALDAIVDDELVGIERANLIDPAAPNPSVEIMLHAFLPHKFVDHTHATAVLSVIDQPDGEARCAEVFGGRLAFVPYLMPGFGLAKTAIDIFERAPASEGLILSKHGIVTFGDSAREAYERMVEMVSLAEDFVERNSKTFVFARLWREIAPLATVAPIVRGACSLRDEKTEGAWRRLVLEFRTSNGVLDFFDSIDLDRVSRAGVVTPDHTIRTKNWPLVLPPPEVGKLDDFKRMSHKAADLFTAHYRNYFARHNKRAGRIKQEFDPLPRVVLVPGLGFFGLGSSKRDAVIAADIAKEWMTVVSTAEHIGRFESISEADMFDCEYWPFEQKKLGARSEPPLAGQIVAVTGAAGAIGAATAKTFAAAGAEVALLDVNLAAATEQAKAIGPTALPIPCDVTDAASVRVAFDAVAENFGGVDIVVSNAGAAWQGRIGEVDEEILRKSFELNF
jgi:rhamnose utilization protein RhaD (predicted bifunctional aldolase and dehydrogenase)